MKAIVRNRFTSIPKRSFRNSVVRMLEEEFKIVGSHIVIQLISDEILRLHKEFYSKIEENSNGSILWRTTSSDSKKPSYGTKVEDYEVKTVVLPLVTEEDVENRIKSHYGKPNSNYEKQTERDIKVMQD